jgi:hypothetical protein
VGAAAAQPQARRIRISHGQEFHRRGADGGDRHNPIVPVALLSARSIAVSVDDGLCGASVEESRGGRSRVARDSPAETHRGAVRLGGIR